MTTQAEIEKRRKKTIQKAKELSRKNFEELPKETRKKIGSPLERLNEIETILNLGDQLNMFWLKQRKEILESKLIEWYYYNDENSVLGKIMRERESKSIEVKL